MLTPHLDTIGEGVKQGNTPTETLIMCSSDLFPSNISCRSSQPPPPSSRQEGVGWGGQQMWAKTNRSPNKVIQVVEVGECEETPCVGPREGKAKPGRLANMCTVTCASRQAMRVWRRRACLRSVLRSQRRLIRTCLSELFTAPVHINKRECVCSCITRFVRTTH